MLTQLVYKNQRFRLYQFETISEKTEPLTRLGGPTTWKSLLVVVTGVGNEKEEVAVLAMEIDVYDNNGMKTIYVGKLDSSGYHHSPSSIKGLIVEILAGIFQHSIVENKDMCIYLFAKSQSQYLFPYSSKNSNKHVLSDRGLVKWWLKTLDQACELAFDDKYKLQKTLWIPQMDEKVQQRLYKVSDEWLIGHPYPNNALALDVIPKFDDDPKNRFMTSNGFDENMTVQKFWEQMDYRNEMGIGKSRGFITATAKHPINISAKLIQIKSFKLNRKTFKRLYDTLISGNYSSLVSARGATNEWVKAAKDTQSTDNIIYTEIEGQKDEPITDKLEKRKEDWSEKPVISLDSGLIRKKPKKQASA